MGLWIKWKTTINKERRNKMSLINGIRNAVDRWKKEVVGVGQETMKKHMERNDDCPPLWFTERKNLEQLFLEWAEENNLAKTPMNVIAWLQINGAINTAATRAILMEEYG